MPFIILENSWTFSVIFSKWKSWRLPLHGKSFQNSVYSFCIMPHSALSFKIMEFKIISKIRDVGSPQIKVTACCFLFCYECNNSHLLSDYGYALNVFRKLTTTLTRSLKRQYIIYSSRDCIASVGSCSTTQMSS